jgi:folylpolyglutamate synthase/dihydropteroate synthase
VRDFAKKDAVITIVPDATQALQDALQGAGKDDLVLATGSFYLIGGLRKRWYSEEWVLQHRQSFEAKTHAKIRS